MIEEKKLPVHELKYYYGERRGFVFKGVSPSSDDAIERLSHAIKNAKVSDSLPEFFVRIDSNTTAFVYPENCEFHSPVVYQMGKRMEMMEMFAVETLMIFLKNYE